MADNVSPVELMSRDFSLAYHAAAEIIKMPDVFCNAIIGIAMNRECSPLIIP